MRVQRNKLLSLARLRVGKTWLAPMWYFPADGIHPHGAADSLWPVDLLARFWAGKKGLSDKIRLLLLVFLHLI